MKQGRKLPKTQQEAVTGQEELIRNFGNLSQKHREQVVMLSCELLEKQKSAYKARQLMSVFEQLSDDTKVSVLTRCILKDLKDRAQLRAQRQADIIQKHGAIQYELDGMPISREIISRESI